MQGRKRKGTCTCKNLLGTASGDSSRAWVLSLPYNLILPSLKGPKRNIDQMVIHWNYVMQVKMAEEYSLRRDGKYFLNGVISKLCSSMWYPIMEYQPWFYITGFQTIRSPSRLQKMAKSSDNLSGIRRKFAYVIIIQFYMAPCFPFHRQDPLFHSSLLTSFCMESLPMEILDHCFY